MFSISFVSAAIEDYDTCEDYCSFDFWTTAMPQCPGAPDSDEGDTGYVPPEDGSSYTPDNQAIPRPADGGPSEPESSPPPADTSPPTEGMVIKSIHGNAFLDYYWD
tara:strand:- start:11 stop:328 length:318 start_codon:yes stop_codon:yes gene_type:complete